MKKIFLSLFLLCCLCSKAQTNYNFYLEDFTSEVSYSFYLDSIQKNTYQLCFQLSMDSVVEGPYLLQGEMIGLYSTLEQCIEGSLHIFFYPTIEEENREIQTYELFTGFLGFKLLYQVSGGDGEFYLNYKAKNIDTRVYLYLGDLEALKELLEDRLN